MAEEILDCVSKLRIDDEEEEILDLHAINPSEENSVCLLLLGRLLTDRSYNVEAFKRTITSVWAPIHGMVIRVLRPNLYAFQFYHWRDMMKVLEGRPWCFDNILILLKEAEGDEQPDKVILNHSPFWVRIKNLPLNNRSDEVVQALIGNMGEVLDIEKDILGFGKYRRVKVMLDVTRPLRRFRKMKDRRGMEFRVDFAYERLPFFCFACGIMGHSEKDCQMVYEEEKLEKLGWSLALKATPRRGMTKEVEEEMKFQSCKKVLFDQSSQVKVVRETSISKKQLSDPKDSLLQTMHPSINDKDEFVPILINNDADIVGGSGIPINEEAVSNVGVGETLVVEGTTEETTINHVPFVFEASKKTFSGANRTWKRLARGELVDKGLGQQMDLDSCDKDNKRPLLVSEMVCDGDDGAAKRLKLSPTHENNSYDLAAVGIDQPRLAL